MLPEGTSTSLVPSPAANCSLSTAGVPLDILRCEQRRQLGNHIFYSGFQWVCFLVDKTIAEVLVFFGVSKDQRSLPVFVHLHIQ